MNRIETFVADAEECIRAKATETSGNFFFSDFIFHEEENTLKFRWTSLISKNVCNISYIGSEDYPYGCFLQQQWEKTGKQESLVYSLSVPDMLKKIGKDLLEYDQSRVKAGDKESTSANVETTETVRMADGISPAAQTGLADSAVVKARDTEDSDGDYTFPDDDSALSSDEDDYHYSFDPNDMFLNGPDDENESSDTASLHPLLRQDIQIFQELLMPSPQPVPSGWRGKDGEQKDPVEDVSDVSEKEPSLCFRVLRELGEVDLDINVPLHNMKLSQQSAAAWKVSLEEPLVVRLNLSAVSYLDHPGPPSVEVFQRKKACGIALQVKNMVNIYLQEIWKKVDNKVLQLIQHSDCAPSNLDGGSGRKGKLLHLLLERTKKVFLRCEKDKKRSAAGSEKGGAVNRSAVEHLVDMGYGEKESQLALTFTNNNLMQAFKVLNKVSSHDGEDTEEEPDQVGQMKKGKTFQQSKRRLSSPLKPKVKKKEPVKRSLSASQTEPNLSEILDKQWRLETSAYAESSMKRLPLEDGFLVMLYRYIRRRVPTVNEYCVVCDKPHIFQTSGAMLMPSVCSRELCLFAYQSLGVMSNATAEIASGAEVVDLLIRMASAACFSERKALIFSPYPNIVDPMHPAAGKLALSDRHKDYSKVEALLRMLPPTEVLMNTPFLELQETLNAQDRLLFPLLSWIICSNRSHIVKLNPNQQLKGMNTQYQFLLRSSPPAQEERFQAAKAIHGSTFAFHGSRIENWHSIIRQGLIVATGTSLQLNGHAHGRGIYLTPNALVSASYSLMGRGEHFIKQEQVKAPRAGQFLPDVPLRCYALCEVINSKELQKNTAEIWTCSRADYVCTRFLFVYEEGQMGSTVNMSEQKYVDMAREAVRSVYYN